MVGLFSDETSKVNSICHLSNYWMELGKLFEKEFVNYGNEFFIVLANGSLALSAYINWICSEDEYLHLRTFIATASSAVLLGAKPLLQM